MIMSWLYQSSSKTSLLIIITTLFISACGSENSAAAAHSNASDKGISNSTKTKETHTNQVATISGIDTGDVTEDLDSNGDGLLGANGKLNITDEDSGEAVFVSEIVNSNFGSVTIETDGNWFYGAINDLDVIQNLNSSETLTDYLTVRSVDGTAHVISITINGVDETSDTAVIKEPEPDTAEDPTTESNTIPADTDATENNSTATNSEAVISGTDTGSVTEDIDSNNDGLLGRNGKLNITDNDPDEAAFIAETVNSSYGSITIDAEGNWFYGAINNLDTIQNLNSNETLIDRLIVTSIDGTTHTVVITIIGADETGSLQADITLSWVAPVERENNEPISLSEIAGYKIYYGNSQGSYNNSVDVNDSTAESYKFTNFPAATYYFVITTYDTKGHESQFSSEVIIDI